MADSPTSSSPSPTHRHLDGNHRHHSPSPPPRSPPPSYLSGRRSSTPTPTSSYLFNRTSVIGSLNQWITDLGINPINALFQSITSPFRRKDPPVPESLSPFRRSRSAIYKGYSFGVRNDEDDDDSSQDD